MIGFDEVMDIIVVHPKEARYFTFERMIKKLHRSLFGKLIVIWSEDFVTGRYYGAEVQASLPFAEFYNTPLGDGDWRNRAINEALEHSTAKWVLFLEQDFLCTDLIVDIFPSNPKDVVGIYTETRPLHPAFLLVKRELIDKTDKDFSAYPEKGLDHFDLFTQQLTKLTDKIDVLNPKKYYHLNGLTHNMRLEAQKKPIVYKPEEYKLFKIMEEIYK